MSNPKKKNAIDETLYLGLTKALSHARLMSDVKVILLTGAGD